MTLTNTKSAVYQAQVLTYEEANQLQFFQNTAIEKIDTIESQLQELIKINNAGRPISPEEFTNQKNTLLNGVDLPHYGVWCYYEWCNKLVHLLPKEAFIKVRTNRNKLKITEEEQQLLLTKKIGIIGLSVGQSVAITMAIERVCGELRLADFDTLELSNLNRLRASVFQLGMPKVIIAAREIAEIDPFLTVSIFEHGITTDNMESFLGDGETKLDLLVEVCDGLDIKINARKAARNKQIAVLMDTNDRGMVDIERFDLEPVRKILHGLIDEEINIGSLTPDQRLQLLMKMVSFENISTRLKQSVPEMGKTITGFPQLASSVMLGGAVTTHIARNILLNQPIPSGRFYIDFDKLIQ
jgi:hypothetical protein